MFIVDGPSFAGDGIAGRPPFALAHAFRAATASAPCVYSESGGAGRRYSSSRHASLFAAARGSARSRSVDGPGVPTGTASASIRCHASADLGDAGTAEPG